MNDVEKRIRFHIELVKKLKAAGAKKDFFSVVSLWLFYNHYRVTLIGSSFDYSRTSVSSSYIAYPDMICRY